MVIPCYGSTPASCRRLSVTNRALAGARDVQQADTAPRSTTSGKAAKCQVFGESIEQLQVRYSTRECGVADRRTRRVACRNRRSRRHNACARSSQLVTLFLFGVAWHGRLLCRGRRPAAPCVDGDKPFPGAAGCTRRSRDGVAGGLSSSKL